MAYTDEQILTDNKIRLELEEPNKRKAMFDYYNKNRLRDSVV